jgi:hypothetical protein
LFSSTSLAIAMSRFEAPIELLSNGCGAAKRMTAMQWLG